MGLVREAIGDVLKPKSEEDIKRSMQSMDSDDLYSQWYSTRNPHFLYAFLDRSDAQNMIEDEDLADISNTFPDIRKKIFTWIVQAIGTKFNDYYITKTKGYNFNFVDWAYLVEFLRTTDIGEDNVEKILSGDAFNLFDGADHIDSISENMGGYWHYVSDGDELKEMMEKEADDPSVLEDVDGIVNLLEFLGENQDDFPEVAQAVKNAMHETEALADEDAAYRGITDKIKKELFGGNTPQWKNDKFAVPVSEDNIITIFQIQQGVDDKIDINPPQYGWSGDVANYEETFLDALSNQFDNIDINEAAKASDFLKPKSEKDVTDAFHDLNIAKQVELINDDERKGTVFPKKDWPLLMRIKEDMKHDETFDKFFRVTSAEPLTYSVHQHDISYIGSYFRVYARQLQSIPHIFVEQLNENPDHIRAYIKTDDNVRGKLVKIKTFKEFWDWMMKAGYKTYINEGISNILKPKSTEDLLKSFKELSVSSQAEWILDNVLYTKDSVISIEHWPLILQIKEGLKHNNEFTNRYEMTSISNRDPFTELYVLPLNGEIQFKIYSKTPTALSNHIQVSQYDSEPHNIRVYDIDKYDTTKEEIIEDYRGFIKWFNDDYLHKWGLIPIAESIKDVLKPKDFKVTNESIIDKWEEKQEEMPQREYKEAVQRIVDTYTKKGVYNFNAEAIKYYVIREIKKGRDPEDLSWVGYENSIYGRRG